MADRSPGDGYTYDGPVYVDARVGLAAARGDISHAAHHVYVAICHHRHGLTAGIADRELEAWAGVERHNIPKALKELREHFPDVLAVMRRKVGRNNWSLYFVPLPASAAARKNGGPQPPNHRPERNGGAEPPKGHGYGGSERPQWVSSTTKREEGGTYGTPLPPNGASRTPGGPGPGHGSAPAPGAPTPVLGAAAPEPGRAPSARDTSARPAASSPAIGGGEPDDVPPGPEPAPAGTPIRGPLAEVWARLERSGRARAATREGGDAQPEDAHDARRGP